jgi:hypothetical protein
MTTLRGGRVRPAGGIKPATGSRGTRRPTLLDPITYLYCLAALLGTSLTQTAVGSLLHRLT